MIRMQIIEGKLNLFDTRGDFYRAIKTEGIARAILEYNKLSYVMPVLLAGNSVKVSSYLLKDEDVEFRAKIRAIRAKNHLKYVPSFHTVTPIESCAYQYQNFLLTREEYLSVRQQALYREFHLHSKGNVAIDDDYIAIPRSAINFRISSFLETYKRSLNGVKLTPVDLGITLLVYKVEIEL